MANELAHRRIVAAGSGWEGLSMPEVRDAITDLSGKAKPSVLYLGTATYDLSKAQAQQTTRFTELGCDVTALKLVQSTPSYEDMQPLFDRADVIIASGGNTLFAVDRWIRLGVDRLIRNALSQGVVLSGGSAGAICWFDGGHSDSMDPASYKQAMITKSATRVEVPMSDAQRQSWAYIRVPGLGLLPGLCCPHHDRTQSNGLLRATDFDQMLLRHAGETGICIDHYAALVIDGEAYRVVSAEGREGSAEGRPGVWRKTVVDGEVLATVAPAAGKVHTLLRKADAIVQDIYLAEARAANPDEQR